VQGQISRCRSRLPQRRRNSIELYEKAGNAQLAREIDAALPVEGSFRLDMKGSNKAFNFFYRGEGENFCL
jgi:hypothetical protein